MAAVPLEGLVRRFALVLLSALVATAAIAIPSVLAAPPTPSASEPPAVAGQLLVGYVEGTSASERAEARSQASAKLLERVVPGGGGRQEVELVSIPEGASRDAAIRRFESYPAVAYAEPNWIVTPAATSDDPAYTGGTLWGMQGDATSPANQYGSQAGEAWAAGNTGSSSVAVGIIDTGVDISHPDLAANVWANPGEIAGNGVDDDRNGYVDDVNGWDFHNGNATVYDAGDGDNHGTHVAGTVAGAGGNGIGVAGVAWSADLITAKFLGPNGGYTSNAVKAVDYLTDLKTRHGLNLVASNNSWGGGGYSSALYDAIERANSAGILFVAAAGNGGKDKVGDDNDVTPHYPSSYANSNIIAVASIDKYGERSGFSNDGSTSVDLGAPGSGIYSTLPGNTYGTYNGTSMATPHVTGGAVLAAAKGLTGDEDIKAAILTSVSATASMDKTVTKGRLDVGGFIPSKATAVDDAYAVPEDAVLSAGGTGEASGVLVNDTNATSAVLASEPSNGVLSFLGSGSFTYAPEPDFASVDSFTYRAVDADGVASAPAMVTITVSGVNDAPVAQGDAYEATSGVELVVTAPGVLGNDTDVEGSELSAVMETEPLNGFLALNGDGSFSYTSDPGYVGGDLFTYRAVDGALSSTPVTVTLTVSAAAVSSSIAVSDLDGTAVNRGRNWTPSVRIHVSPAVADAVVSGQWGTSSTVSCTTDSSGSCTVTGPTVHKSISTVTFTVTGISSGSLAYDATLNADPETDSDGTSITIAKP